MRLNCHFGSRLFGLAVATSFQVGSVSVDAWCGVDWELGFGGAPEPCVAAGLLLWQSVLQAADAPRSAEARQLPGRFPHAASSSQGGGLGCGGAA